MKKTITCAGYGYTGSSAVTDLLHEFDNINVNNSIEARFIYDPFGISDLEYFLVENPNRHNASYAIKEFRKYAYYLSKYGTLGELEKQFNYNFMKITDDYINKLIISNYDAIWTYEYYKKGNIYITFMRVYNRLKKVITKLITHKIASKDFFFMDGINYCTIHNQEQFIEYTKEYINNLFNETNKNYEFNYFDQLVPSSNIERYIRYFDDIKVICVDRDPRDIYILEQEVWKTHQIPSDVEKFCSWYRWQREIKPIDCSNNSNIMKINFEDFIYSYEKSVERIYEFLQIDESHHKQKKKYLNPEISIQNTQLKKSFSKYNKEIKIIEQKLKQFLYEFPDIHIKANVKDMF